MTFDAPTPEGRPSPIADLSYRTYDGPLNARTFRWWTIALASVKLSIRKKGFWPLVALAAFPWVFVAIGIYIRVMTGAAAEMFGPMSGKGSYAADFFRGASQQTLWLFLMTLLVGAGSIATDNGANALLVYLSKPITKSDYLIGKWMGIFIVVFAAAVLPALALYLFCAGFFAKKGFFTEDPLLILRIIGAATAPAFIHASVMVGISAWSRTARAAGTAYAAFYFITGALTRIILLAKFRNDQERGADASAFALDGLIRGLMQNIYHVTNKTFSFSHHGPGFKDVPAPNLWLLLALAATLVVICVGAARARIRAVEVVKG